MPNLVNVQYKQTGKSTSINSYGMREMQERAYEKRDAQYLLLKSPPASGKSRALIVHWLGQTGEPRAEKGDCCCT